mmetsp:Transcript_28490/g.66844  ORF Transcript_28490/g.66844 Transcript_28490/m.66844 type:complete len:222 (-) Transcript_28490:610-1275(-)
MPSSACCCFSWMFSLADARVPRGAGVRRSRRFGGSAFGEGKQARIGPIWDGGYGNETDADYLLEEEQPHLQALVNLKTLEGDWILNKAKSEPLDPLLSVMDICWHPALPTRCDPPECTEYNISMMRQTFTPVRMGQPMYAVIPLDGSVVRVPSPAGGTARARCLSLEPGQLAVLWARPAHVGAHCLQDTWTLLSPDRAARTLEYCGTVITLEYVRIGTLSR